MKVSLQAIFLGLTVSYLHYDAAARSLPAPKKDDVGIDALPGNSYNLLAKDPPTTIASEGLHEVEGRGLKIPRIEIFDPIERVPAAPKPVTDPSTGPDEPDTDSPGFLDPDDPDPPASGDGEGFLDPATFTRVTPSAENPTPSPSDPTPKVTPTTTGPVQSPSPTTKPTAKSTTKDQPSATKTKDEPDLPDAPDLGSTSSYASTTSSSSQGYFEMLVTLFEVLGTLPQPTSVS